MMRKHGTIEEEQLRQLKIISMQKAPLWAFVRIGFWLFAVLFVIGLLAMPFLWR
jgi:hypothetical protein